MRDTSCTAEEKTNHVIYLNILPLHSWIYSRMHNRWNEVFFLDSEENLFQSQQRFLQKSLNGQLWLKTTEIIFLIFDVDVGKIKTKHNRIEMSSTGILTLKCRIDTQLAWFGGLSTSRYFRFFQACTRNSIRLTHWYLKNKYLQNGKTKKGKLWV